MGIDTPKADEERNKEIELWVEQKERREQRRNKQLEIEGLAVSIRFDFDEFEVMSGSPKPDIKRSINYYIKFVNRIKKEVTDVMKEGGLTVEEDHLEEVSYLISSFKEIGRMLMDRVINEETGEDLKEDLKMISGILQTNF